MDFTGKPMRGYVFVAPAGFRTSASLRKWIDAGRDFVGGLPDKEVGKSPKRVPSE